MTAELTLDLHKKMKGILKKRVPLSSEMNSDKTPIFWLHCERYMNSSFAPKADCVLYVVSQWIKINSEGFFLYLLAFSLVYSRLGLGLIPKPKLANTRVVITTKATKATKAAALIDF